MGQETIGEVMKYAKRLSENFVSKYADKTPPWGPVGYVTYKRTYARNYEGKKEEWYQTLERACNGLIAIGGVFTQDELERLYDHMFNLRCCMSGRSLWQLGTDTVLKIGADSLQSCWHVATNHPIDPFTFTFNQLMLGGGVGMNITPEFVYELPIIKYSPTITRKENFDVDFIVPDNREGWVELLRGILGAFYFTGKDFSYSADCIRARGKPIAGFGGTASGSEKLVEGIGQIVQILRERFGQKLRPIDCLDIYNIIGSIVVAGNVRRSAEIVQGSCEDIKFLQAKNWSLHQIPNWRNMSNNTVHCNEIGALPQEYWQGYEGMGEAYGLFNLELSRTAGRLIDHQGPHIDPYVIGTNPCGEITLEDRESCNLFEVFLSNVEDEAQFHDVASLGYKVCKTISAFKFSDPKTQEVVNRNHRLGIGLTGIVEATHLVDADILDSVYTHMRELDVTYSKELGVNVSNKLTTVKPSGTLSLLAGCTSGANSGYAAYLIRRIRFATNDPLVAECRKHGYHVEPILNNDGSYDLETMVVSFPVATAKQAKLAEYENAIDQLERQKWLQTHWSDNAVSLTCYHDKDEVEDIQDWLADNYNKGVKATSFQLHSGHGFAQAPLEEISEAHYLQLKSKCKPLTRFNEKNNSFDISNEECASGACPIR